MLSTLLISALLFAQIPLRPAEGGTVTGVLKDSAGKPIAGVRVAAVTLPDAIKEGNAAAATATPAAMSSIAETDAQGRYTLESIPQGRYYIAAGRVDQPTYYPGTRDMPGATIVSVMPGTTVPGIDFILNAASAGRASEFGIGIITIRSVLPTLTVPLEVRAQNGGRVPVFTAGKFPELRLTGSPASTSVSLVSASVDVYGPTSDYQVTVENLPDAYSIQSITYGNKDITKGSLKFSTVDFANGNLNMTALVTGMSTQQPVSAADLVHWPVAPGKLIITLRDAAPAVRSDSGVRVRGRIPAGERRSIYLSGTPGTIYSDGTFEFNGVRPGLHMIASLDNADPLGAMVAVGKEDVAEVELKPTRIFPANMRIEREPGPLGSIAPGTAIPPATVRGRLTEEITQTPIPEGLVRVLGYSNTAENTIIHDGRFEMSLLPGTYVLKFEIFGHSNLTRTLTVGTENIILDLTTRRLY